MTCYKKILFFLLIFLFLFCSCSFCTETLVNPTSGAGGSLAFQNDNQFLTFQQIEENIQNDFIQVLISRKGTDNNANGLVNRIWQLFQGHGGNAFIYVEDNLSSYGDRYVVYSGYLTAMTKSCVAGYSYANLNFTNVPVINGTFQVLGGIGESGCYYNSSFGTTKSLKIPLAFSSVVSPQFLELFKVYGFVTDSNFNTFNNNINNMNSNISSQANQTRQEIEKSANKINDKIENSTNKINDNINNNDTSEIDTSGITNSDTTVDITQDGFNSIFTTLQNYFTSNNGGSMVLTIPFVNKSITISKSTVYGNFKQLSTIENLASLVWYFVISLYIVKQVQNMINKIKSGNLEDVVDNNVKADIL